MFPPPVLPDATLQLVFDLVGVFVFGLSGALVAVRERLDVFGIVVLAVATGLGGGLLRDVLIGAVPPATLTDYRYTLVAVVAGCVAFAGHARYPRLGSRIRRRLGTAVTVLDAAGLGVFCVAGALKALVYLPGPVPAALLGMVTAVGGGVIRDLLTGRVPVVLHREVYAVPALVGAALVVAADHVGWRQWWVALAAAAVVFALRLVAVVRDWHAPRPGV